VNEHTLDPVADVKTGEDPSLQWCARTRLPRAPRGETPIADARDQAAPPSRRRTGEAGRCRAWRWLAGGIAAAGIVPWLALAAWAQSPDGRLRDLSCVDVSVGTFQAPESLGISEKAVRHALEAGLKTRLPQLRVLMICPDVLRALVVLATLSPETFYGMADVTLLRRAIVVDTGQFSRAETWRTTFVLHGPAPEAGEHLFRVLDSMLDRFVDEYSADGQK
jgi:hypothetical protein